MKVKIKRLDPSVELPQYQTAESAAFDIAANEDATISPKEIKLIKTGLIIEAPHGHFLLIASRSSTPVKKGLSVPQAIGIVDRDFSGPTDEVRLQLFNFTEQPVMIKKGERLAQGMFLAVDHIEWEEVDQIREQSRGGFGSTGGLNG
ncbi:MAG: dUTPase [Candidatus Doudnabacteria bacterium RIFCSPLOWO2_02_FULL_49_13]|uniref:dUTP diphosphatase n=1 Tax=Candidatus Doudnabacteria bacterium RIFCSPHIGHO2_12_FULL_48_16 TaxID=1817838 RepID=A0A1F5PL03_9BACT|nr:MAG: dUTPase [Candidatus Doudnabacteria bacterium RIFCSPHIGHO2_02_FULL_49_24]OGE88121.1 MAG: dUTPase [Candidatus Doudnabacteria bacterium RIFCSPHIGHO2_01_FULL_50_67]OGE90596.1 MAG: dUTPase [Candidatus Doudnabacteria bacterium RIFCSPHIGHO2_12_FULL_48_16]OGE96480.1 MAG: dUTPase [Candidatus Doudnabacteria bacterium RIFCSPLOWO2_01_FULL_49_40]OGF02989.1 MAG: dUTPase [Candidatus Doudnabacteria bacterium RIFCSPLOWO2_02_FULL_49_13]OGF03836.1 MAG: dUTPase [Candidatus Doudnabacteria bacterium RIFCSPL